MNASLLLATLLFSQVAAPIDHAAWPEMPPPALSAADQAMAEETLLQMWGTLEKLQTGDVSIHEEYRGSAGEEIFQTRLIFDNRENSFRFEVLASPLDEREKYLRSPQGNFVAAAGEQSIYRDPNSKWLFLMKTQPFDPRTIGFGLVRAHLELPWFKTRYTVDQQNYTHGKLSEVSMSEDQWIDLVWIGESQGERFRTLVRVDARQGYAPVFHAHWRTKPYREYKLYSSGSTQWMMRDKIWTPVRAEYEDFQNRTKHTVTLVWNSVNESIPAETFTLKGLDLTTGLPVMQIEDQQRGVVGTIGADGELIPK